MFTATNILIPALPDGAPQYHSRSGGTKSGPIHTHNTMIHYSVAFHKDQRSNNHLQRHTLVSLAYQFATRDRYQHPRGAGGYWQQGRKEGRKEGRSEQEGRRDRTPLLPVPRPCTRASTRPSARDALPGGLVDTREIQQQRGTTTTRVSTSVRNGDYSSIRRPTGAGRYWLKPVTPNWGGIFRRNRSDKQDLACVTATTKKLSRFRPHHPVRHHVYLHLPPLRCLCLPYLPSAYNRLLPELLAVRLHPFRGHLRLGFNIAGKHPIRLVLVLLWALLEARAAERKWGRGWRCTEWRGEKAGGEEDGE
jgi:hypothetical protein